MLKVHSKETGSISAKTRQYPKTVGMFTAILLRSTRGLERTIQAGQPRHGMKESKVFTLTWDKLSSTFNLNSQQGNNGWKVSAKSATITTEAQKCHQLLLTEGGEPSSSAYTTPRHAKSSSATSHLANLTISPASARQSNRALITHTYTHIPQITVNHVIQVDCPTLGAPCSLEAAMLQACC